MASRSASGLSGRMHTTGAPGQQQGGLQVGRPVVAVQVVHQAEVEVALQDTAVDLGLLRADHLDLGGRMTLPELPDRRGEQRHGGRVHRAHPDHPDAAVLLIGGGAEPVHRIQHGEDVGEQVAAGIAHPGPVPPPLQHVDAQFALQAAHRAAQRRLRDVQLLGRPAERAQPGDRREVLELFDPHSISSCLPESSYQCFRSF